MLYLVFLINKIKNRILFNSTLQNLIDDNSNLFSLPEIVIQLNTLIDDPNSNIDQISELILKDAPLTVRLLKLVNSSYYNFSSPIDTVSQAINVIGTKELSDIVMATKMIKKFNYCPLPNITADDFWRHNLACAIAARAIATELKIINSERFFVSGLIHDIGKLVLYVTQPKLCEYLIKKIKSQQGDINELEYKIFGFSHCDVGALLLKSWDLPKIFIETTQYHHFPERAEEYSIEVAIIHLANAIANLIERPLSNEDCNPINPFVWKTLGIDSEMLNPLTAICDTKYKQSSPIFLDKKAA